MNQQAKAKNWENTLKIADTSAQDVQLAPKPKHKRNFIGGIALLFALIIAWIMIPVVNRWANTTVTVPLDRLRIATVITGDLVRDVSVQGRVVAAISPTLYATAPGSISLYVAAGSTVEKGQVLALVDSPELTNRLKQAQSSHEQQVTELERQRIESRQVALEKRKGVDELLLRSPVNGVVGDLLVEQKNAVSRDTPVMSVVDLSRFEIDAQIPESYADDLAVGMQAEILLSGQTYAGELVAVSPEIVGNQVASRIRFSGEMPQNIRQNQRLTTRILLEERPNVLMLQRGQFLESGGGRVAYVLNDDAIAMRRQIEIGARSLAAVEITSGLRKGDDVIISSIDQFRGAESVLVTN